MYPFNPNLEFEQIVLNLNEQHTPGSVTSGKTRNALLFAWALVAGKKRAARELSAALDRHGSRAALARHLRMSPETLRQFTDHVSQLSESYSLPPTRKAFSTAFGKLSTEEQLSFAKVAAELLGRPELLRRLTSSHGRPATRLLEAALRAAELQHALENLRDLLQSGIADEQTYQDWCDDHSWVFAGAHQVRDDVRRLHDDSIVDLLLPDVVGYRDVVELKRPDAEVLRYDRSHRTHYFARELAKAIGQVHKYLDRLHDLARAGLAAHPHIVAYHPRATIVIGRSKDWKGDKTDALRGLNQRLHGVSVMTYDHLLLRAESILSTLHGSKKPA